MLYFNKFRQRSIASANNESIEQLKVWNDTNVNKAAFFSKCSRNSRQNISAISKYKNPKNTNEKLIKNQFQEKPGLDFTPHSSELIAAGGGSFISQSSVLSKLSVMKEKPPVQFPINDLGQ